MTSFDQYLYPERPDVDDDVVVFHAGFCSTTPYYSSGRDVRDCYLIHYVRNGKGVFTANGVSHRLSANQGFLISPHVPFVHVADAGEPWDLFWVAFFGRHAEQLLQKANLDEQHPIFQDGQDDLLENCIMNIYNESRARKNMSSILGYFYLFMGRLADNYQAACEASPETAYAYTRFEDAMNYINRNICTRITIGDLAGFLQLHPSQIYRIFRNRVGMSPQRYIVKLRMEKACSLLEKTDLTISDVSKWLNFEYQSHFTKQFKGVVGVSPAQYRSGLIHSD